MRSSSMSVSSGDSSALNGTTYTLRMLSEERAEVLLPRSIFRPDTPLASPLPLKSRPGLALSPNPPSVPPVRPASPVTLASSLGYARSLGGLPWSSGAQNLSGPYAVIGSNPQRVGWNPWATEHQRAFYRPTTPRLPEVTATPPRITGYVL